MACPGLLPRERERQIARQHAEALCLHLCLSKRMRTPNRPILTKLAITTIMLQPGTTSIQGPPSSRCSSRRAIRLRMALGTALPKESRKEFPARVRASGKEFQPFRGQRFEHGPLGAAIPYLLESQAGNPHPAPSRAVYVCIPHFT